MLNFKNLLIMQEEIISKINTKDADFLKYLPDGFLSENQKAAKQEAISKQKAKVSRYSYDQQEIKHSLSNNNRAKGNDGWQIKGVDVLLQQEADKNGLVWENGVPFRKDLLELAKQQAEEDFQIAPPTRKRCKSKYGPVKKYPQRCCNCRCW